MIKFRISWAGEVVFFQVLEQAEETRNMGLLLSAKGWKVVSKAYPAISDLTAKEIYVRGSDRGHDHDVVFLYARNKFVRPRLYRQTA
jgi:predicted phosphatase